MHHYILDSASVLVEQEIRSVEILLYDKFQCDFRSFAKLILLFFGFVVSVLFGAYEEVRAKTAYEVKNIGTYIILRLLRAPTAKCSRWISEG